MKEKNGDMQVIIKGTLDLTQMPEDILEAFVSALEQAVSEYYEND